jgi:hypothetical protein
MLLQHVAMMLPALPVWHSCGIQQGGHRRRWFVCEHCTCLAYTRRDALPITSCHGHHNNSDVVAFKLAHYIFLNAHYIHDLFRLTVSRTKS